MNNSLPSVGLVVGKFSPLHLGHEWLIEHALSRVNRLVILSYSLPEFPGAHATLRQRWLKQRFPQAEVFVLDAWQLNEFSHQFEIQVPANDAADDLHREFCAKFLGFKLNEPITDVFTSEEYGQGFAEYLTQFYQERGHQDHRVKHHCVDLDRKQFNIAASQLRNGHEPLEKWLSPQVRSDFKIRSLCFLGAESTGKSTLAQLLAEKYQEPAITEYGRELWDFKKGNLDKFDLYMIAKTQQEREDQARQTARKWIFCDTSPLTTLFYYEHFFKERTGYLDVLANTPYHVVYLCYPDFPLVQDGTRHNEVFRQEQHNWYIQELNRRRIPYTPLIGAMSLRLTEIQKDLESLE